MTLLGAVAILLLESAENVQVQKPRQRQLVGRLCLVTKRISKGERGFVKVYDPIEQKLSPEIWSAESDSEIEEGKTAIVTGMRSIILRVAVQRDEK